MFNGRFLFGGPRDAGPIPSTNSYTWQICNATGTAGPAPNAQNQVSGWTLILVTPNSSGTRNGQFYWDATPTDKFDFALETLINPTTVGSDVQGPMANFNTNQSYSWAVVQFAGSYLTQNTAAYPNGAPADSATLNASTNFDFTNFVNTGTVPSEFGWYLAFDIPGNANAGGSLDLVYTPVPAPGTLALTALGLLGVWRFRRRS
jgi:PEP-CTERM motif